MEIKPSSRIRNVENDPRLLFWFAIVLMLGMFIWSFFMTPELRQPGRFALFTGLFAAHLFLHWKVNWVDKHRRWLWVYTLVQGALAFAVTYLSANIGMVFCLFMALIGELLAIYKITVGGIAASLYLLGLAFVNFKLLVGSQQAIWFALGTIPTLIFVAIYVILFSRQTDANTQARILLEELEEANRKLSEYAAQVEDLTLSNERQRMARELHDTLSQGLAGLILQLEAVDAHLASQRIERGRSILTQSMEKARATLAEARQAIDNLRQPVERDLVELVQQESAHFTNSTGIRCEPQIDLEAEIPEAVAEAAGRAISESLTNIARHARAKNMTLQVSGRSQQLKIEICDDGVGFDPEAVQAGHYGLLGMRERIRLAGGTLTVQSAMGEGTSIEINFPLQGNSHG
jgi:NarL family two-component system sensor histidine kinase YdfH